MRCSTIPCCDGSVPVEMLAVFTRVTVGKTECARVYQTPLVFKRLRFGVTSAVIDSGRSPSMTRITTNGRAVGRAWRCRER